jgi:hypothetical protein
MEELHPSPLSDNTNLSSPGSNSQYYERVMVGDKKLFKCLSPGCGKTFKFKSDMERHVVIHTNTRPYACAHPSCGKTFKRPDALKSHMETHNEEVHLECPVPGCKAQFQKKSALQYHLLKHQQPNHFLCSFQGCHQTFTSYNDLKQHQKKDCKSKKSSAMQKSSPKTQEEETFVFDISDDSSKDFENFSWNDDEELQILSSPTKKLHTTESEVRVPLQKNDSFDFSERSTGAQSRPSLSEKDNNTPGFIQSICKQLLQENAKLKKELEDKMNSIQSKYGDDSRLNSLLTQALDFQVEETEAISKP